MSLLRFGIASIVFAAALMVVSLAAAPQAVADEVIVVDMLGDPTGTGDACTDAPNDCDLRGAVAAANALVGPATIEFDIPVGLCPDGICKSQITDGPIVIEDTVTIDGTTQPQGSSPQANACATKSEPSRMRIELSFSGDDGFHINHSGAGSAVKGLSIVTHSGAVLTDSVAIRVIEGSPHIACNHIGVDALGTGHSSGWFENGVAVEATAGGAIIGTDGDGQDDLTERNVLAYGLRGDVVILGSDDNWVAGNYFGVGSDGALALNAMGLRIESGSNNTVGCNDDGTSDDLEGNFFLIPEEAVYLSPAAGSVRDNKIVGNTFSRQVAHLYDTRFGIFMTGLRDADTGNEIRSNVFGSVQFAIHVGAYSDTSVLISDNTFGGTSPSGTQVHNAIAIELGGEGTHVIRDNTIRNSDFAALYVTGSVTIAPGSEGNCLVGNGRTFVNETGVDLSVANNWWGSADGPSGVGPGTGDPVQNGIDYTPWLEVAPKHCNGVPEGQTFFDVSPSHTFFSDIEWLADEGVTKGCNPPNNTMFCPDDVVSRGQMAAFLHRALGGTLTPGAEPSFTDIAGSVFTDDIMWLGSVSVTRGCNPPTNDRYCPDDDVTRGQMAAFLVRAFGYTEGLGSDRFTDDDGSVFEGNIEMLAEAGVTLGCNPPTNDMFCPSSPVTRAQMAAFLHRAMG